MNLDDLSRYLLVAYVLGVVFGVFVSIIAAHSASQSSAQSFSAYTALRARAAEDGER